MPQGKNKRSGDKIYAFFPGEEPWHGGKKPALEPVLEPVLEPSSISRAWERCGDGFQSGQADEVPSCSENKPKAVRHLMKSLLSEKETSVTDSPKEPAVILWSDSDLSNDGSKDSIERSSQQTDQVSYPNICAPEESSSEGDVPQIIDWQEDSDYEGEDEKYSLFEMAESTLEISDCESSTSNIDGSQTLKTTTVEISEYSSDNSLEDTLMSASGSKFPLNDDGGATLVGRSASDWVKTAQALLQTPEKKLDKPCKTPEDSAKKKRRFLRGGLAERLNRLQNRERSAVSFWRHQCESECKMPLGSKPGTLTVKIIEIHEECLMQVALCQQLTPDESFFTGSPIKVLFAQQTVAHLRPAPNDIIHISTPWQKLTLQNENISVILNTHFSQKNILNQNEEAKKRTYCSEVSTVKRKPVSLSWIFKINDIGFKCHSDSVVNRQTYINQGKRCSSCPTINDSLLDVIETQGAAAWKGTCRSIVVQRIYCLPIKESRILQGSSKQVSTQEMSGCRLCFLIQDAYGIFSELYLQSSISSADDLEQYCKKWEGKMCRLSGMKILQRTTRARAPGLFSLIDSLWPPLVPVKVHGQSQAQMQRNLPAPSFCYLLAAYHDEGSECIQVEADTCDFYLPPVVHSLRDVLQVVSPSQRCTFWGTVIYMRPEQIQYGLSSQQEISLFVTDTTLQEAQDCPRTLPVYVSPSCVLDSRLLQHFTKKSRCAICFKDAVRENGKIICVERTVLSLQNPLLSGASGVNELTDPVKLDVLDSTTQVNSLCSVKGVVVGVNERTAFSWPVCNQCGSSKLQPVDGGTFFCRQCTQALNSPVMKMKLEVFLQCSTRPQCKLKVKLQQETISHLLLFSSSEDGRYEVNSVLGREVGALNCYVQSVNNTVGLEEICILNTGS
ncbi:DNA repair-scaffolding protein [Bombina bombina]|uniref:DNA repair-scaffolding protein n=1 Tax=Bombina bombina TaxID=8345 RepID=UPI00235AA209|nr:DNA repair-scaffolding protein [Bombina bombina]